MKILCQILGVLMAIMPICASGEYKQPEARYFNVASGLSGDRIFSLAQDSLGFVWCASLWGIDRLDGTNTKSYYLEHDGELLSLYSNLTKVYSFGRYVYVSTQKGFTFRYNPLLDSFQEHVDLNRLGLDPDFDQKALFVDKNGRFYIATTKGLYEVTGDESISLIGSEEDVSTVVGDNDGSIYYAVKNSLFQYSSGEVSKVTACEDPIKTMHIAGKIVYMGTINGDLYIYNSRSGKLTKSKAFNKKVHITSISNGLPGELLIATDGNGCHIYDIHSDSAINISILDVKLTSNAVMDVLCDRDNNIWIATYGGAVNMIQKESVVHNVMQPPHGGKLGNTIYPGADGMIWFASDDGVYKFDSNKNSWHQYAKELSVKGPVLALAEDSNGNIWAAGFGCGLIRINPDGGQISHFGTETPLFDITLVSDYIASIMINNDNLWIGSYSEGRLMKYDLQHHTGKVYDIPDVHALSVTENGNILCGQSIQMSVLNPDSEDVEIIPVGVAVNEIMTDGDKAFLATSGKGILEYDLNNKTLNPILPDNDALRYVMAIEYSVDEGTIYFTTHRAFYKYNMTTNSLIEESDLIGLANETYNERALCMMQNSKILIGSSANVVEIDLLKDSDRIDIPYIYFSGLKMAYSEVSPGEADSILPKSLNYMERLVIPYNHQSFSISFAMVNFSKSSVFELEYRLSPFEKEWVSGKERNHTANYANVKPGNYTFQLRLKDKRNSQVLAERDLPICLEGPIWTKWWMWIVYAIIIALGCIGLLHIIRNKLRQTYNEEKMRLFTEMAHELRTPVALIKAPLSELANDKNLSCENRNTLEIALRNTERLHELTTQLMDFQKADANAMLLNPIAVDLYEFMLSKLGSWEFKAKRKNLEFKTDVDGLKNTVSIIDPQKMDAIIGNLLSNAIKYTNKGNIHVRGWVDNGYAYIAISDTGIGIPEEEQSRLFRQFFRARNARISQAEGTGIGLMLTNKLVELHGGKLYFNSKENYGSEFTIKLSIGKGNISTSTNFEEVDKQNDSGESILVVDDNADMREVIKNSLASRYFVMVAKDAKEAFSLMERKMPDLIVSDLMMPGMSGDELCKNLKNKIETSHIPFILLTAVSDREVKMDALNCGADDYITKPFDIIELKARIKIHLRHSQRIKENFQELDSTSDNTDFINPLDKEFMEKIESQIENNIDNPDYTVVALSSDMAMSRASLYNKLKAVTGQSPNEFIRLYRLKRAAMLLKQNRYSVSEVAVLTGFADTKYFATAFKRQFGTTPSTFGKQT